MVPFGIIGALLAQAVDDNLLKARYGILILILAAVILQRQSGIAPDASEMDVETKERRRIVDRDGTTYEYPLPRQGIEGSKGNPFQTRNRIRYILERLSRMGLQEKRADRAVLDHGGFQAFQLRNIQRVLNVVTDDYHSLRFDIWGREEHIFLAFGRLRHC